MPILGKTYPFAGTVGAAPTNIDDLADVSASSPATGDLLVYSGVAWSKLTTTTAGKVLQSQGVGVLPAWSVAGSGNMNSATYDPASVSEQLVGLTATQTITNKTISGGSY